jgi:rsbT co-antagonist protein RsbR
VADQSNSTLTRLVETRRPELLSAWIAEQMAAQSRNGLISEGEIRATCSDFLDAFQYAIGSGTDISRREWDSVRSLLERLSLSRAQQGFSPSETALYVFALRRPLLEQLRDMVSDVNQLWSEITTVSGVIDALGLYTTEVHQRGREDVIMRQQSDMLELSTPVVNLWDGILALPMIGTLDSSRTQTVMESLLQRIVETGADVAVLDITGVPAVDTLTAQHLLKTVTAARLMGAECIISGIRPQIAQTIVHLGVDLGDVITKATLADAFRVALQRRGLAVGRVARTA